MIVGSHVIIYSRNADADRAFFRDVLKFSHVDVGHGWLIFGLPPSEVAVHPGEGPETHEFYLLCEDIKVFVQTMKKQGLICAPVREERWGSLTQLTLPGGGALGVYQPRHARPAQIATSDRARPSRRTPKAPKGAPRRKPPAKR